MQKMADQEQSDFYIVLIMSLCDLTLYETLITLLFERILVRSYKDSKESFAASNYFVISLVRDLFLAGNQQRVRKMLSLCCCLKYLKIQTHDLPCWMKTNYNSCQINGKIKIPHAQ